MGTLRPSRGPRDSPLSPAESFFPCGATAMPLFRLCVRMRLCTGLLQYVLLCGGPGVCRKGAGGLHPASGTPRGLALLPPCHCPGLAPSAGWLWVLVAPRRVLEEVGRQPPYPTKVSARLEMCTHTKGQGRTQPCAQAPLSVASLCVLRTGV